MSFANPEYLYLGLAVLVVVGVGVLRHSRRRRRLAGFLGGGRAAARLSKTSLTRFPAGRLVLLGGAVLALTILAADPVWTPAPSESSPPPTRDVVLAIDVSVSMQASDEAPTRLARAVDLAHRLVAVQPDDRIGMLLFAGDAYVLAPPTHDHRALTYLLDGIAPTIASAHDPGTRPSSAINAGTSLLGIPTGTDGERAAGIAVLEGRGQAVEPTAGDALPAGPADIGIERAIVLISDGEAGEPDDAVFAAVAAAVEGDVTVHAIAVGTDGGGVMTMPAAPYQLAGPIVGQDGQRAVSHLRQPLLREIADVGGGAYALASDEAQIESLFGAIRQPTPRPETPEEEPPLWAQYDITFWLAAGALLALLLESLQETRLPRGLMTASRRRLA